jgi:hypothetical protein
MPVSEPKISLKLIYLSSWITSMPAVAEDTSLSMY